LSELPAEKKYLEAIRGPENEATPLKDWLNWRRKEAAPEGGMTVT
jgi:hypothetical protein